MDDQYYSDRLQNVTPTVLAMQLYTKSCNLGYVIIAQEDRVTLEVVQSVSIVGKTFNLFPKY